jgi:hypothetical protein
VPNAERATSSGVSGAVLAGNAASAQEGRNGAKLLSTGPGKILNFLGLLGLTGLIRPPIHRAHAARGQRLAGGVLSLAGLNFVPETGLFDIVILGRGTWAAARSSARDASHGRKNRAIRTLAFFSK